MTPLASIAPTLYRRQLHRYLLGRMRNNIDIDDLAQQVWERLARTHDDRPIDKPLAFIFGIASHVIADHFEALDRRRNVISDSIGMVDDYDESHSYIVQDDKEDRLNLQQQIDKAIGQLPPTHAAVILAHKRDGLSYEECAEKLGLSIHTVEKYVTKAKTKLRGMIWDL